MVTRVCKASTFLIVELEDFNPHEKSDELFDSVNCLEETTIDFKMCLGGPPSQLCTVQRLSAPLTKELMISSPILYLLIKARIMLNIFF